MEIMIYPFHPVHPCKKLIVLNRDVGDTRDKKNEELNAYPFYPVHPCKINYEERI
jgi:hypothetical protein